MQCLLRFEDVEVLILLSLLYEVSLVESVSFQLLLFQPMLIGQILQLFDDFRSFVQIYG